MINVEPTKKGKVRKYIDEITAVVTISDIIVTAFVEAGYDVEIEQYDKQRHSDLPQEKLTIYKNLN